MYNSIPFMIPNSETSLLGKASLLNKINFSSLLTNTQKILNVANQAIPLYYQTKPIFKNIKTITKIGKTISQPNIKNSNNNKEKYTNNNIYNIPKPTFFL